MARRGRWMAAGRTLGAATTAVVAATTVAVGALAAGCDNDVDTSENVLPYLSEQDAAAEPDPGAPPADVDTGTDACSCAEVGLWYRFDALTILTLDEDPDHPVIPTLNSLWQEDIANNELNILFEVTSVSPDEIVVRGVNGARVVGSDDICVLDETSVEFTFPRSGCQLDASAESDFNVYAGTTEHPKNCTNTLPVPHAIPLSRTVLQASVTEDCGAIVGGYVPQGMLGESDLFQICACLTLPGDPAEQCGELDPSHDPGGACQGCNGSYTSLGSLLTAFGEVPFACTNDQGDPAACLTADFSAVRLDAAPATCD